MSAYGLGALVAHPLDVVYYVVGLPIYGLYPWSMVIFGGFGLFLCLTKDRGTGLVVALAAGTMFDLMGSALAGKHADALSFLFWLTPVALTFILTRKSLAGFLSSRAFLAYLVLAMSDVIPHALYAYYDEAVLEAVWCAFFYAAFYGGSLNAKDLAAALHLYHDSRTPRNPVEAS